MVATQAQQDFAVKLQEQTSGCRLNTYGLSTRRSMSKAQIERVAQTFHADADYVGGSRTVLDRKHELIAPIFSLMFAAKSIVKAHTLDYPERGLRLVKVDKIEWLAEKIDLMRVELDVHLAALDAGWAEIKEAAKERLAELYNESDYAVTPSQAFGIEISFPAIKPDDRLLSLHPELYAREQERIRARFDEAIRNAEAAAAEQLEKMLRHFVSKLTEVGPDGKRKVFHESTIQNIRDFTAQFKELSIGSNQDLDSLVDQISELANDTDVAMVRKGSAEDRQKVAERFAEMLARVDDLMIDLPVREMDLD